MWTDLMRVQIPDIAFFAYICLMVIVVAVSIVVFTSFVGSKPDGRKTVIGNIENNLYFIAL